MLDNTSYTVGWICALAVERVAAEAFLDETHEGPVSISAQDNNIYTLGRMGRHNVVITVLPDGEYGVSSATNAARDMVHTFPNIRIGLMVGIGGGVPSAKHDIRLGDVVVSATRDGYGGVVQYDFGKRVQDRPFQRTGFLGQSPRVLRVAVNDLKARYELDGHRLEKAIDHALDKKPRLRRQYGRPSAGSDRLYKSQIVHPYERVEDACVDVCGDREEDLVVRLDRTDDDDSPMIHYGLIASGNQVIKDARMRDELAKENILCFDMEAAGLMNAFPCSIVRGISDYSDSHKNKTWQGYAAMTAAAYAKDLLGRVHPTTVENEERLADVVCRMADEVRSLSAHTQATAATVQNLSTTHMQDKIRLWLKSQDPSTNQINALAQRHPDTGLWFLQGTAFEEWKTQKNSFLWLCGSAGCGKTILASAIVDDLCRSLDPSRVVYFYFDFNDSRKQAFDGMLRSVTEQLYSKQQTYRNILDSAYASHWNGNHQPDIKTLCANFARMVEQANEIWIVLDALDECNTRSEMLPWLKSILQNQHGHVHLLVTSRLETDIQSEIDSWSFNSSIIPLDNEDDIETYIRTRVRVDKGLQRWQSRPDVRNEIEDSLIQRADGMFRWVACQLDSLAKCLDYSMLSEALETLPATLNETYDRMLRTLPDDYKPKAVRILQFLAFGNRPLTVDEVVEIVAVRTDRLPRFRVEDRMPVPQEVVRYCGGLAVAVRVTNPWDRETVRMELRLSHFTVKEFLTARKLGEDTMCRRFDHIVAKTEMAIVCLAYLLHVLDLERCLRLPEREPASKLFPLTEYAGYCWVEYAVDGDDGDETLTQLFVELCENHGQLHLLAPVNWDQFLNPQRLTLYGGFRGRRNATVPVVETPLCYASERGLLGLARCLISLGADVNYGDPLRLACLQGHTKMVQFLLDNGADLNTSEALYSACLARQPDIVRLLIERGANIDRQTRSLRVGHEDMPVVKVLLEYWDGS